MKHHFDPILMNLICPFLKKTFLGFSLDPYPFEVSLPSVKAGESLMLHELEIQDCWSRWQKGQRSGCAGVEQWCELETPQKTHRVTTSLERGRGSFIYQSDKESCGEGAPASLKEWMWGTPLSLMPVGDSQRRRWMEWALEERWGEQEDLGWSTHPSGCPTWRSIRGSRSIKTSTLLLDQK